ncbi:MAG: hypothetical protein LBB36_02895 [Fibromonadaceae bacterium]|jgi:hypothetical protein|nr:hypothetical protein [Fibromonadaceae bacterium]
MYYKPNFQLFSLLNSQFSIITLISALLISCSEQTVTVSYDLQTPVKIEIFSQSHYATMNGDIEEVGTITATHFTHEYSKDDDMLYLERVFIADASKGYLKKSYPAELALRTPKMRLTAKGLKVVDITGYEDFDSAVVAKISIPDRWKKQISSMTRQIDLDRLERRRWELTHLLLGEVPLNKNVTRQLGSQGRLPAIPLIQIDSVLTKEIREINGIKCLEYTVFLQEKEPFPYFIWEQHTSSVKSGMPFKSYHPKDAVYQTRYEVAINPKNGIPCQEREFKFGTHGMQNPETGDSVTFKSQISHERFYDRR